MDKKKTVSFLTLGCKVNSYETEAMEQLFIKAGYEVLPFTEQSSIYIVNTCTVTNIADRKSRQMLHKAKKKNSHAVIVAVGCYVQVAKNSLEEDSSIDLVIGNNNKNKIVDIVEQYLKDNSKKEEIFDLSKETNYEVLGIESVADKTRAYIKIQDGCNQFCSYCIIPYARGRVRSRTKEDILQEINVLAKKGYQEIVLTGIHLSSYGIDFKDNIEQKTLLLSLILSISKIEPLKRIRLGSLEPRIITKEFVETLAKNNKICPHFHLSLQSGCNTTLKRMNRKYTTEEYYEACNLLRYYFEQPAITTDIIVGFPGETEEQFQESKAFLESVQFSQMHVFKYSKRKGTRAESMPDQVEDTVKSKRSNELLALNQQMQKEYRSLFQNKEVFILIEEKVIINNIEYQIGHNERYVKFAIQSELDRTNQIIKAKVQQQLKDGILYCEMM